MKNRILYVITVTALVLGAFSAKTYVDNRNLAAFYSKSIITAAQDLPAEDAALVQQIGEESVPLAGGPGEVATEQSGPGVSGPGEAAEGPGVSSDASAAAPISDEHPNVQKVIDLVNAEREKAGLAPLSKNSALCSAAAVRAQEISTSFSHTRPDGRSYKTAIEEAGVTLHGVGENVAMGYRTAEDVMSGWMGSEGHRDNILLNKYTSMGVGYYKADNGYCYWAQEFSY